MTRIAAVLVLALVLALPAVAGAQSATGPQTVKLAYQDGEPNGGPRFEFGASWWNANGIWKFTGPTDARASMDMITLDLKYRWQGPWSFGAEYSFGGWNNIRFNDTAAPSSISGTENIWGVDVRYRVGMGGRVPTDVIVGWQGFRTSTSNSQLTSTDEARATGYRIGLESMYPINAQWSVRGLFTYAPSLGVSESYNDPFQSSQLTYHGTMTDFRLAVGYSWADAWKAELGYRYSFIQFNRPADTVLNRPADTVDHSLDGFFLNLVYRR